MSRPLVALGKTLAFTLLVPATVAGWIPRWLRGQTAPVAARGFELSVAAGVVCSGIAIYLYTAFWSFAWIGGGTPAPVAAPKALVVSGLHRFVRNPMYIGVGLIIAGQAWLFHSLAIAIYLALFGLVVHLFVVFYEEPALQRQFGAEYKCYRATVPRWIPKIRF